MENQNKQTMQITGSQLQTVFLLTLATLAGYVIATNLIMPGVEFWRFFILEIVILGLARLAGHLNKK